MQPSFDEHLETALGEYNERISMLESGEGTPEELLDALLNRSRILSMMEHNISAISDLDDAIEIIEELETDGKRVDVGTFVKAHVSRGELVCSDDPSMMAEDYSMAATRLSELTPESRYFDEKKLIMTCIYCCEDLVDSGYPGDITPYIERLLSLLHKKTDDWSRNRYLETLNLQGQALMDMSFPDPAAECFNKAVDIGYDLKEKEALEDTMSLVFPLVSRGDIEQQKGLLDQYFADRRISITLLEEMMEMNQLDDIQVLVKLHQDVAHTYLTLNKVKEAEEHLMREVMLNMDGAEEYIREYSGRDIPKE